MSKISMKRMKNLSWILMSCYLVAGCQQAGSSDWAKDEHVKPLPKLTFHMPKTFGDAVGRLVKIHAVLNSSGQIPEPTKFKVVEVIHGTGAVAHSHFHLYRSDGGGDDGHSHEGMERAEKLHDLEVDIFTEYVDIARWLPSIAADSNMEKSDWDRVKKLSGSLEELLRQSFDKQLAEDNRSSYSAISSKSQELIVELEGMVAKDSEAESEGNE